MEKDWFFDYIATQLKKEVPRIFVETGTYKAENIPSKIGSFDEIHSIDLNINFVEDAKRKINHHSVTFHHGESSDVLKKLIYKWREPVVFYLDAHWSGGKTAFGREETPLLEELKVLSARQYDDIVFIDDIRLLGKKGQSGISGSEEWPLINYDWEKVTVDALEISYKPGFKLIRTGHKDIGVLNEILPVQRL